MGTGKTASLVVGIENIKRATGQGALVIVPAFLRKNWVREFMLWAPGLYAREVKSARDLPDLGGPLPDALVMSYEIAVKLIDRLPDYLFTHSTVVFDEAHFLKSLKSKRTQVLIGKGSLGSKAKTCWLATGTPFPNSIADSYTLFAFATRGRVGRWYDYCRDYGYVEDTLYGLKTYGCKEYALPELKKIVSPIFHRDEIKDVIKDLPSVRDSIVPVDEKAKKVPAQIEQEILSAIEAGQSPTGEHISALRIEMTNKKLPMAAEFIESRLSVRPLLVFGYHKVPLQSLYSALRERSLGRQEVSGPLGRYKGGEHEVALITGDTSMGQRDALVQKFQAGEIKVLLCTIPSMKVGVTLTNATDCIYLEHPWTPEEYTQSRARVYRIGQKNPVTYHHLLFDEGIDMSIFQLLQRKCRDVNTAMAGIR